MNRQNAVDNRFTVNELQALKACFEDAIYFKNMLLQISELPESGLLINGFMSEASMFVIESYDCLIKVVPEVKPLFDSASIEALRQSRHRAKILEYTKDINSGLNDLSIINTEQVEEFQKDHTGFFSRLKQFIQPDLGITKYKGHFITTTHSTIFDLGPGVKLDEKHLFDLGQSIGIYLQNIIETFEIDEIRINSNYISQENEYQMLDIKSKVLFERSKFKGDNKKFASALILILVRLNYTKMMTSQFLPKTSHALIRSKFINTYHACKSLIKIQSVVMKGTPSDNERMFFKAIFSNEDAKWLLRQSSLRNLFAHYLLDKKQLKRMPNKLTREEVVGILSGGLLFEAIEEILDTVIESVTTEIEGFFELNDSSFRVNIVEF